MGEHGVSWENAENKDGKHQPDDLTALFIIQNTLFVTQNIRFGRSDDSKHFLLRLLCRRSKTPNHFRMGEHQAKCRALTGGENRFDECLLFNELHDYSTSTN